MTDANLEALELEAAAILAGNRPLLRQAIPIRIVENLQLAAVTPEAIRRRLQGHMVQAGAIIGVEWFLLDHDESTAIYAAKCPYPFCNGKGDLLASTTMDRKGNAVLPFDSPGALCCDVCDREIEARYDAEAAKLANPRKSSGPRTCQGCDSTLPVGSPANTRYCQPCATARVLEAKRMAMAKSREADKVATSVAVETATLQRNKPTVLRG